MSARVVVIGSSGFIGGAVTAALRDGGAEVVELRAPRLASLSESEAESWRTSAEPSTELVAALVGATAVVNAAGNPDASSTDEGALIAANAVLPGLIARAAAAVTPTPRFVHISSAVVLGRRPILDDTPAERGFSAYSRSKALGESLALELGPGQTTVYRPPSVHAPDRRVTRMIGRIARSPLSVVAGPGTQPTPQALLSNVASAVAFLATTEQIPPRVVTHPSEGLTTASLLEALGGRTPRHVPAVIARVIVSALTTIGSIVPTVAANARRVEMILLGQAQATSWLTLAGWRPIEGPDAWRRLGSVIAPATQLEAEGLDK